MMEADEMQSNEIYIRSIEMLMEHVAKLQEENNKLIDALGRAHERICDLEEQYQLVVPPDNWPRTRSDNSLKKLMGEIYGGSFD